MACGAGDEREVGDGELSDGKLFRQAFEWIRCHLDWHLSLGTGGPGLYCRWCRRASVVGLCYGREACLPQLSQKPWLGLFLAVLDFFLVVVFCVAWAQGWVAPVRLVKLCRWGVSVGREGLSWVAGSPSHSPRWLPSAPTSATGFVALLCILPPFKKAASLFLLVVMQRQYVLLLGVTAGLWPGMVQGPLSTFPSKATFSLRGGGDCKILNRIKTKIKTQITCNFAIQR